MRCAPLANLALFRGDRLSAVLPATAVVENLSVDMTGFGLPIFVDRTAAGVAALLSGLFVELEIAGHVELEIDVDEMDVVLSSSSAQVGMTTLAETCIFFCACLLRQFIVFLVSSVVTSSALSAAACFGVNVLLACSVLGLHVFTGFTVGDLPLFLSACTCTFCSPSQFGSPHSASPHAGLKNFRMKFTGSLRFPRLEFL